MLDIAPKRTILFQLLFFLLVVVVVVVVVGHPVKHIRIIEIQ